MDYGVFNADQESSVTRREPESSARSQVTLRMSVEGMRLGSDLTSRAPTKKYPAVQTYEDQRSVVMLEESRREHALQQRAERRRHVTREGKARSGKTFKVELPALPNTDHINLYPQTSLSAQSQETCQNLPDVCCLTKEDTHSHPRLHSTHSWPSSFSIGDRSFGNPFGVRLPLTPPKEVDFFSWPDRQPSTVAPRQQSLSSEQDNSRPEFTGQQQSSTARPSSISLPGFVNMADQSTSPSTWLERTVNTIVSCHADDLTSRGQVQMVVQALPSQSQSPTGKPAFQELAETLQQRATTVPYIMITHAVSQVVSMDQVPVSPPATPNNQQESDDYFDSQTIFTHAAAVPNYHGPSHLTASASNPPSGTIAAPSSIDIGTLERYIPPTTAEEVEDFFSISRRSYLVDRLTELSATNGTLLLVYPTQVGGAVFARQYLAPIIDPYLRRFVILNNLTVDVADAMGKLAALPKMKTFEEMETGLRDLCQGLTQRAPARGIRGTYKVIHAEKNEVILDRTTWMGWFLEQESARLRQNIIEYQKAGGRMPSRGFDATPGSLAREVVEGIKNSKEEAGGAGIEVGVFVIRRSVV